jgi:hypothetical protein
MAEHFGDGTNAANDTIGGGFLPASGAVDLASMKEVFDKPGFHDRVELVGLNKVVLHRIPWTRQRGLFKTEDVAESFGMDPLRKAEGKAISNKSLMTS